MRKLIVAFTAVVVFAGAALAASDGTTVQADDVGADKPTTPLPDEPEITAVVTNPGSTSPGTPATPEPVGCDWFVYRASDADADAYNDAFGSIIDVINIVVGAKIRVTITFFSDLGRLHRWNDVNGKFEQHQVADCSRATDPAGVSDGDGRWVVVGPPDPAILLPGATEQATKPITTPLPTLSPAARAPVNLGMWLSVQPAGPIVARAELGPLWAETTATLATTSFDLGTGDAPVVCDGHGTPIPDNKKNSIDQGPCGYTYRADSDGGSFDITITSTWTVTWELSGGSTGSEPNIAVTAVLPYEVYEIQTVGTGG